MFRDPESEFACAVCLLFYFILFYPRARLELYYI